MREVYQNKGLLVTRNDGVERYYRPYIDEVSFSVSEAFNNRPAHVFTFAFLDSDCLVLKGDKNEVFIYATNINRYINGIDSIEK